MVSCGFSDFYGFTILCFYGCVVLWFCGFEVFRIFNSWLLIDIDFISIALDISLDGSAGIFGACLFPRVKQIRFTIFEIYENNIFENVPGIILVCFRYPGVSRDK